jgi:hypothetical protein
MQTKERHIEVANSASFCGESTHVVNQKAYSFAVASVFACLLQFFDIGWTPKVQYLYFCLQMEDDV